MSGQETFEFAAAVAGVSIGLAAVLLLAVLGVVGTWRLFRHASETSQAATRAALAAEEVSRRVAGAPAGGEAAPEGEELAELRHQTESLMEQQRHLEEMARSMLDTAAQGGPTPPGLEDVESAIIRLDGTVGQMAASITNLIQLLERQQRAP
ncbi:MAG: hypothetical protein U1B78_01995 [Dehalococcoidia bacterium]|nr:hypothetical protein [Dehalococcoidia bacterium]